MRRRRYAKNPEFMGNMTLGSIDYSLSPFSKLFKET